MTKDISRVCLRKMQCHNKHLWDLQSPSALCLPPNQKLAMCKRQSHPCTVVRPLTSVVPKVEQKKKVLLFFLTIKGYSNKQN